MIPPYSGTQTSFVVVPNINVFCDGCSQGPLDKHWHCNVCDSGDYDLCDQCCKSGGCGHAMIGRHVRDGKIVHRCSREQCYFEGPTREALENHYQESSIHGVCLKCWPRPDFKSKEALLDHWKTSQNHHWCVHCERDFDTANSLSEHGKVHKIRNVECLGCDRYFPSRSALMIHLESGNCPCGMTDADVRKVATQCRQRGLIIVRGMERYLNCYRPLVAGPDQYNYVTQRYECPACDKSFDQFVGLRHHMFSPVHSELAIKCPNTACGAKFNSISGLLQHMESRPCEESVEGTKAIKELMGWIDQRCLELVGLV